MHLSGLLSGEAVTRTIRVESRLRSGSTNETTSNLSRFTLQHRPILFMSKQFSSMEMNCFYFGGFVVALVSP